jgi:hypothetical protein
MTSSVGTVRAVTGLVPPLGRAKFILSPSRKRRSISLYLAASKAVEDKGLVEWMMVTLNLMRLHGVFQCPVLREWSNRIDKSNGCSRGSEGEGTMLCASHSSYVLESIIPTKGRMCLKVLMISSRMLLLALVLWLALQPRQ